jgi:polyisoprenyl-phosphate glycosyltransferase
VLSLIVAFGYLIAKLVFWDQLQLGLAPLLIGIYFFGAVQLFFIGLLGEYIGSIHTQVHKRPLVVEKERINFERDTDGFHRDADGFLLPARDDTSRAKERVNSLR